MPARHATYRFRVTRRETGKIIAYTNVKAVGLHDAMEILLKRLHVPESQWNSIRNPYILDVKLGGKYRSP